MAPPAPRNRRRSARLLRSLLWAGPAAILAAPAAASPLSWRVIQAPTAAPAPQPSPTSIAVSAPLQVAPSKVAPPKVAPSKVAPSTRIEVAQAPAAASTPTPASSPASSLASAPASSSVRDSLRIPPLVKTRKPWPAPSLSPGVPSSFVANWGDVFIGIAGATAGKQRGGTADGSWGAGFGIGDSAKAVALELSGGCGSIKNFCANGSFDARIGRLLINEASSRLGVSAAWQNFAQWGNEGRVDDVFYGGLTYAMALNPDNRDFPQTLQFNAGVGNSRYAPYSATDSQNKIGGFGSVGIELTPYLGVAAGWSGRGANAQLSITPFRDVPISINLLGADLFDQTPAGTVGVLSVSWGTNFRTASFD